MAMSSPQLCQVKASALSSTATQKLLDAQDTAASPYPLLSRVGADQVVPLKVTERLSSWSTAMQKDEEVHDTAARPPPDTPSRTSTVVLVAQEPPWYV
jgi:hypothetical protein